MRPMDSAVEEMMMMVAWCAVWFLAFRWWCSATLATLQCAFPGSKPQVHGVYILFSKLDGHPFPNFFWTHRETPTHTETLSKLRPLWSSAPGSQLLRRGADAITITLTYLSRAHIATSGPGSGLNAPTHLESVTIKSRPNAHRQSYRRLVTHEPSNSLHWDSGEVVSNISLRFYMQ